MTKLAVFNILIVVCVEVVIGTPCFEQHHPPCVPSPPCAPAPPPCGGPLAHPNEHHCRDKDHSEEKKDHKKCKDKKKKKKKKKKDKKNHDDENRSASVEIDIDINIYGEMFTRSEYVDNVEGDTYVFWMKKCTHEQLEYIDIVADYLEVHESLSGEIIDYEIFHQSINSVYEVLKSEHIYSTQVDLRSKRSVFEKVKVHLVEAMSGLSEQSALYVALSYCVEHEITIMPIIVGLCRSVAMSQETYFSRTTTRSTSGHCGCEEKHSKEEKHKKKECECKEKKHEKKKCEDHSKEEEHHEKKCQEEKKKKDKKECKDHSGEEKHDENIFVNIDIDINVCAEVFTESQYVDNSERDTYINWMEQCRQDQLQYVNILVKYLQIQEALSSEIIDYQRFRQSICTVYENFKSSNIYTTHTDLCTQTQIFEQAKTQITEAMSGLSEQSRMYEVLNYCTQSETTMMPLVVGLCRSVALSQETYFSQSSSSYASTTTHSDN